MSRTDYEQVLFVEQAGRGRECGILRQQLRDHLPMHVGQPPVDAVVAEGQPRVVDAQQVQHRGVHVVAVGRLVRRLVRPLVARAVAHAALDAAAGQPGGEGERIVVAALAALAARHPAELRRPEDDRVVEQCRATSDP